MDPDIVTVVNEPECRWAQHRFCLRHLCFEFYEAFRNNLMTEFVYKAGSTVCVSKLFISQRELLNSGDNKYAKHVMTKLGEYNKGRYDVLPLDNTGERFQVVVADGDNNKRFVVHRIDRVCSCGMWQLYKYPCSHLLAVCRKLNIDFCQYVND
ncbi:hypothetical protein Rs2_47120 [Raphanus sativus]|nr:hypothetical protein Rs2_47120 [Raphanus sativus]